MPLDPEEDEPELSPAEESSLMQSRALLLAKPKEPEVSPEETIQVLSFELGGELYALEVNHLLEVVRLSNFTPVPGAPPSVVGIMNFAGEMLPLVDLRFFFGLPVNGIPNLTFALVMGFEAPDLGVLVDAACDILRLKPAEILEPPTSLGGPGRGCARGVTATGLIVLDGAKILEHPALLAEEHV